VAGFTTETRRTGDDFSFFVIPLLFSVFPAKAGIQGDSLVLPGFPLSRERRFKESWMVRP
jgi:hypothetical protein